VSEQSKVCKSAIVTTPVDVLPSSTWSKIGFTAVRLVLGLVLLGAAALKLFSFGDDPGFVSRVGLFADPLWRMAAIEIEAVLGLWLLTGLFPRLLWWSALFCFGVLAGTSSYLGVVGQPSCGCFGAKLPLSPWYAFALDSFALASLVVFRPARVLRIDRAERRRILAAIAISAGAVVVLACGSICAYGSIGEAVLHLRGEAVTVDPPLSDVGEAHGFEERSAAIQLTNHTDHPVRVFGASATCSCVAWDDLPVVIPPHGDQSITIRLSLHGLPRDIQQSFTLFTDEKSQPQVYGEVIGRLSGKTEP
jgi:uncharacterized membrane protein YphA (DoxX/SURF4 family)